MGLDVALGVIIVIAAIRGWLQGFTTQVIRIGGLIACVYLAAPVREQVKPHVMGYLPAIRPELMERLLWWAAASVTWIVLVGVATLAVKMTRRPEIPGLPPQRSRNDQFAGFLVGIAKGGLVAAFLVAGLEKYGLKQVEAFPWVKDQTKASRALVWNERYRPAERIWESGPVRHFVNHIQRMGLPPSTSPAATDDAEDAPVVQTAQRVPGDSAPRAVGGQSIQGGPPAPPAPGSVGSRLPDAAEESGAAVTQTARDANPKPR